MNKKKLVKATQGKQIREIPGSAFSTVITRYSSHAFSNHYIANLYQLFTNKFPRFGSNYLRPSLFKTFFLSKQKET